MKSLSIFVIFFLLLIELNVCVQYSNDIDILTVSKTELLKSNETNCISPCTTYINNTCIIKYNYCFIGRECYETNQTHLNNSLTCLQCQPKLSQTQWSFNEICSAGQLCMDPWFLLENTCDKRISEAFYNDPIRASIDLYNFIECDKDPKDCQAGFFQSKNKQKIYACCPGYFCPDSQVCMIPCRFGSYCPSPLPAFNGICQTLVKCPPHQPNDFDYYGCGGSTIEGYCPTGTYCPNPTINQSCPSNTNYCPMGVQEALPCPSGFVCLNGRTEKTRLITIVLTVVIAILVTFVVCVKISELSIWDKIIFAQHQIADPPGISQYFRERTSLSSSNEEIQLHIHLNQAKLRDVTQFDSKLNSGFTGRIIAGKLTALMGGSGCGKSSLLETIHGRRRLRSNGYITFAEYEPLSTELTDYIGYVPQADIMHHDLTVFETVYYSARTRRLGDQKQIIINDVCFVLEKLGLKNMHNSMTKTLSGGQRKRVNIAMEVAACPKVLLLDEPTSGLDTVSCDDLFDLLQLIKHSIAGPVTILMVIHQPSHELFEKIDYVFFLTPLCCLAYQGPREQAKQYLKTKIFQNRQDCPPPRHNDCDTCFIMLTKAQHHIDNHIIQDEQIKQELSTYSWNKRALLPFLYVFLRSVRQIFLRGVVAEVAYLFAYFLLGACVGYIFENKQQRTCDISVLPTIYFLISLSFGILTCISSQRLFGVEIINQTFERESRNYFHPFQYWFAKSLVDISRLLLYPLLFLSILYIEIVPRASFSYYYSVMILLSFACSGIGQFTSVIFNRTEYAYLGGTIIALISCLLSGFSPRKSDLGSVQFIMTISFSRHIQHLLYIHETALYVKGVPQNTHIWSVQVEQFRKLYSYENNEHPYFSLIFIGLFLRLLTFICLYAKSEYRSKIRFYITHAIPTFKSIFTCESCREHSHQNNISIEKYTQDSLSTKL